MSKIINFAPQLTTWDKFSTSPSSAASVDLPQHPVPPIVISKGTRRWWNRVIILGVQK
jgi:hypothetical protein